MRWFWIAFGVAAHVLFVVTVWFLFPFFRGPSPDADLPESAPGWWWLDFLLAAHFGVFHSLLLAKGARKAIERVIPAPLYGCFFCVATCASLLLIIFAWQPSGIEVLRLTGTAGVAVNVLYLVGWGLMVYSLLLEGLGYQTGWVPYWAYVRDQQPPRRRFEPRGLYLVLRHPVYLSVLVILWATPALTADRLLLTGVLTVYIFVGSYLKDRRMTFYLGDQYRTYQARVPGYPFFWFGPLGRVSTGTREPVAAILPPLAPASGERGRGEGAACLPPHPLPLSPEAGARGESPPPPL